MAAISLTVKRGRACLGRGKLNPPSVYGVEMPTRVSKEKFDAVLKKLLSTAPEPRNKNKKRKG
jgi:hypothetical protein